MPLDSLKVQIPASSTNLGPGFDCFGLALDIFNEYEVDFLESKNEFSINSNLKENFCPNNKKNIFYTSYRTLLEKNSITQIPSLEVKLNAQIPSSGGFGSSGTAVLAGLIIANKVLNNKLNNSEILKEACLIEKHPDNVCASLLGAFCLSKFEEDELVYKRLAWDLNLDILMLYPTNFRINTSDARKALKKEHPIEASISNLSNAALFTAAVATKDLDLLKESIKDALHEKERLALIPGAQELIKIAKDQKAIGATISGSGASLIVFADSKTQIDKIRLQAKEHWAKNNIESESLVCKVSNSGALIY